MLTSGLDLHIHPAQAPLDTHHIRTNTCKNIQLVIGKLAFWGTRLFVFFISYIYCLCACVYTCAIDRGQIAGVCSLLLPRGTQKSNSGCQSWLQEPLPQSHLASPYSPFPSLPLSPYSLWGSYVTVWSRLALNSGLRPPSAEITVVNHTINCIWDIRWIVQVNG